MAVNINKTFIDNAIAGFKEGSETEYHFDSSLKGLGMRIYPSKKVHFFLRYYIAGKRKFVPLGKYGEITLSQARERALKAKGGVYDGSDPAEERATKKRGYTMSDLCDKYLKEGIPNGDIKNATRFVEKKIKPYFTTRPISAITKADIVEFHKNYQGGKIQADRCISCISGMFIFAESKKMDVNKEYPNPTLKAIKRTKTKNIGRSLEDSEMKKLMGAIAVYSKPIMRSLIFMLLFTGVRKAKIQGLKWEQVALEDKFFLEVDPKNAKGEIHKHPLPTKCIEMLSDLKAYCEKEGYNPSYVFPSKTSASGHIEEIKKAWKEIVKSSKILVTGGFRLRPHDLRHTFKTWVRQSSKDAVLSQKITGHKTADADWLYHHVTPQEVATAVEETVNNMFATIENK